MTHGDKFRQMSDESLAGFITDTGLCPPTCTEERRRCANCTNDYVSMQWLEYLEKEIEDNAH